MLLEPANPDYKSPGGLYLPEAFVDQEPTYRGTVLKVGEECVKTQVGQDVYYVRHCGNPIIFGGKDFIVIKEVDLIARVETGKEPT